MTDQRVSTTLSEIEEVSRASSCPLRDAVLCVECDAIYRNERLECPDCGSRQALSLARVLRPREDS